MQYTLYVQRFYGTFLYYSIAVRQTMLVALNAIDTSQAHIKPTTMGYIIWLFNYVATHPDSTLHYHASNMILHVSSNESYLCKEHARSRSGGHFFLSDRLFDNGNKPSSLPTSNVAIHTLCQLIKTVISSAEEAEIGATFLNAKDDLPTRTTSRISDTPNPPLPCK